MTYRQVKSVPWLEVTADADFRYNGKTKKAIYCHTVTGRKATVRIMIMWDAKSHYWQAAKLVAEAGKRTPPGLTKRGEEPGTTSFIRKTRLLTRQTSP